MHRYVSRRELKKGSQINPNSLSVFGKLKSFCFHSIDPPIIWETQEDAARIETAARFPLN